MRGVTSHTTLTQPEGAIDLPDVIQQRFVSYIINVAIWPARVSRLP
jgi:hypothetical protein